MRNVDIRVDEKRARRTDNAECRRLLEVLRAQRSAPDNCPYLTEHVVSEPGEREERTMRKLSGTEERLLDHLRDKGILAEHGIGDGGALGILLTRKLPWSYQCAENLINGREYGVGACVFWEGFGDGREQFEKFMGWEPEDAEERTTRKLSSTEMDLVRNLDRQGMLADYGIGVGESTKGKLVLLFKREMSVSFMNAVALAESSGVRVVCFWEKYKSGQEEFDLATGKTRAREDGMPSEQSASESRARDLNLDEYALMLKLRNLGVVQDYKIDAGRNRPAVLLNKHGWENGKSSQGVRRDVQMEVNASGLTVDLYDGETDSGRADFENRPVERKSKAQEVNMSDKVLVVEMGRYKTLVFGSVLHMAESLRGKGELSMVDGFAIVSDSFPQLLSTSLCVWGMRMASDHKTFSFTYNTEEDANSMVVLIAKVVKLVNEKYAPEKKEEPIDPVEVLLIS